MSHYSTCLVVKLHQVPSGHELMSLWLRCRQLGDGSSSQDKWTGYYRSWEERAGIMIPLEMESVWNLISGKFSFARLTVVDYKCFSRIGRTSMSTCR